jgi:phosphoribosyl-AMP cyclohydrolase
VTEDEKTLELAKAIHLGRRRAYQTGDRHWDIVADSLQEIYIKTAGHVLKVLEAEGLKVVADGEGVTQEQMVELALKIGEAEARAQRVEAELVLMKGERDEAVARVQQLRKDCDAMAQALKSQVGMGGGLGYGQVVPVPGSALDRERQQQEMLAKVARQQARPWYAKHAGKAGP